MKNKCVRLLQPCGPWKRSTSSLTSSSESSSRLCSPATGSDGQLNHFGERSHAVRYSCAELCAVAVEASKLHGSAISSNGICNSNLRKLCAHHLSKRTDLRATLYVILTTSSGPACSTGLSGAAPCALHYGPRDANGTCGVPFRTSEATPGRTCIVLHKCAVCGPYVHLFLEVGYIVMF